MEFPLTINNIEHCKDKSIIKSTSYKTGELLFVTPKDNIYNNKEYKGYFLGEVSNTVYVGHNEEDNILKVGFWMHSPAVFVPELGKIFYNYNSVFSKKESYDKVDKLLEVYKTLSKEQQLMLKKIINDLKE